MNRWVEERVEAIRLALRIPGFPAEADLYRLVDWLDGCVILRHSGVPVGMCVHREDHRAVITLPLGVTGPALDHILAEEIGHYLLTRGMGALLRQMEPDAERIARLARKWEWRDEALAREFVHAWHLPSALVQAVQDDEELAFRSRCALELVRRRRESLAGEVVELREPPRWSASREYSLTAQAGPSLSALRIARRGETDPVFLFSVPVGEEAHAAAQLAADLIALTGREFELKYAGSRYSPGETVELTLSELRAWAGHPVDE